MLLKKSFLVAFLGMFLLSLFSTAPKVQAITADEIRAQIAELQQQILQLQQQLAEIEDGEEAWCHDFEINLRIGDQGAEVEALQLALGKEGDLVYDKNTNGIFDEYCASAVTGFQEKYREDILAPWGLTYGTGYVGRTTRAKLNELYGCAVQPTTCVKEGEDILRQGSQSCCAGLSQISRVSAYDATCNILGADPFDVCTYCSNGTCGKGENKCNCPQDCEVTACTDSDGGKNYYEKGTATQANRSYPDYCYGAFSVREYFCEGDLVKEEVHVCADNASCSNGACEQPAPEPAKSVSVNSPNGGEQITRGSSYTITWTSEGLRDYVMIDILKGGLVHQTLSQLVQGIGVPSIPNTGSYVWELSDSYQLGSDYKVKIRDAYDPSVYDESDDYFSVVEVAEKLTVSISSSSPPPQLIRAGTASVPIFAFELEAGVDAKVTGILITVEKDVTDTFKYLSFGDLKNARLFINGEQWGATQGNPSSNMWFHGSTILKKGTPEIFKLVVDVPETTTAHSLQAFIPIGDVANYIDSYEYPSGVPIKETGGATGNIMTIIVSPEPAKALSVNSPNGGEKITRGSSYAITWTSQNLREYVMIDIMKAGRVHQTLTQLVKGIPVPSMPNTGSYLWTLSDSYQIGSDYKVKIRDAYDPSVYDESDDYFSVVDCAAEGETFSSVYEDYPANCCSGLTEWQSGMDTRISIADLCYDTGREVGAPWGRCINCGNGVCEEKENPCNCLSDCLGENKSTFASVEEFCQSDDWKLSFSISCDTLPYMEDYPICALCP